MGITKSVLINTGDERESGVNDAFKTVSPSAQNKDTIITNTGTTSKVRAYLERKMPSQVLTNLTFQAVDDLVRSQDFRAAEVSEEIVWSQGLI